MLSHKIALLNSIQIIFI